MIFAKKKYLNEKKEFLKSWDMVEGSLNDTHKPPGLSQCVQGHANGRFFVRHWRGRATLSDTGNGQVISTCETWRLTIQIGHWIIHWASPSVMPDVCLTPLTRARSQADVLLFHFFTVLLALLTSTSIFAPVCEYCGIVAVSSIPCRNIELWYWHISAKWEM